MAFIQGSTTLDQNSPSQWPLIVFTFIHRRPHDAIWAFEFSYGEDGIESYNGCDVPGWAVVRSDFQPQVRHVEDAFLAGQLMR